VSTLWQATDVARGDEYDDRWMALRAAGLNVHGEADLVESLLTAAGGRTVLDAGCGTGRVAIELARRGFVVTGVDADPEMLATARANAPELDWADGDLADEDVVGLPDRVDLVLLAGNVMIFLESGTEAQVLANLAARLSPGGLLVAGFALQPDRLSLARYDALVGAVGLAPVARWATWDRQPFDGGDYAVSVHRSA
jgi:SAM-dependent methyltransferase